MSKAVKNKKLGLLKSVEERALSKKAEDEQKKKQIPYFHKDCISNILIRLPLKSLQSSRFVCKPWYNIINSRIFIDAHLRRSESVLIFLKSVSEEKTYPCSTTSIPRMEPHRFSVETSLLQSKSVPMFGQPVQTSTSKFYIQFMEFTEGKLEVGEYNVTCAGRIRATCNGLILLDNMLKRGGLIVMNPVTRKLRALPLGTLFPPHSQTYGFALSDVTGVYKVVHMFRDELGHISCETLELGARSWKAVNGPSFGLLRWFGSKPIQAIGALHWIPQVNHSDYLVSMEVDGEKFHTIPLPKSCGAHDRIIEMGGVLCFVTHEELNIDIWNLKNVCGDEWTMQYRISRGCILDMVPLLSLRISGDIVFRRVEDGSVYAYDFKFQEMREMEVNEKESSINSSYLAHVNSLVSWTRSPHVWD